MVSALLLAFAAPSCFAGTMENDEALAFSTFIRDLIHTSSLSSAKANTICGFGGDEVFKVISSQEKNFINLNDDPKRYQNCKAIYIAKGMERVLRTEIEKFNKKGIMTIAIFDGFVELGGMVQVQMGRRDFELTLNLRQLRDSGVRLSALALSLVIN